MKLLVVPNALANAINKRLDDEIAKHPDAAQDRRLFYEQILLFFDKNGYLPDFTLEEKSN
jgi:hypothetical protein